MSEASKIAAVRNQFQTTLMAGRQVRIYDPPYYLMRVLDQIEANKECALLHDRDDGNWLAFIDGRNISTIPSFDATFAFLHRQMLKRFG